MVFVCQMGVAADKIIDGFTGTDSLSINYSGISGISDFVITKSGDYKVLTDSNGNTISFKNIETLTIAGITYVDIYQGRDSSGGGTVNNAPYSDPANFKPCGAGDMSCLGSYNNNSISSAMYSRNDALVFLYPFADTSGSNFTIPSLAQSFGYDGSSALTITGTAYNDTVSDRDSDINPGGYSISTYAGIDVIDIDNSKAADTVDAGADNDFVFVTTASGKSFTSDTAIKGGLGSDWLIISSAYSGGTNISINYTINSSPTSGFENVLVSSGDDALTGDASNNILLGSGGADTINGLAGNDSLYGYHLMEDGCSYGGSNDGSDKLYGGDGDDLLVGGAGDDLFDGGIGQDTLTGDGGIESCGYLASQMQGGASGSDTFVIRSGDGGSSITDADIITDFTDGTDIIGMSGLNYNQLTIEQGTGSYSSHVVVKKTSSGEFLTIIQNVSLADINYLDILSTSTIAVTLTGSTDDDLLLGGYGNDSISSDTGTDVILGYGGNDLININGSGNKTIDGGVGTDSLSINYSGISGISDFVITKSGDYKVLTDSNGNTISFKNIETLTIAGITYVDIYQGRDSSGGGTVNNAPYSDPANFKPCGAGDMSCLGSYNNNSISSAMYSRNDALVFLYPFADTSGSNFTIPSLAQSFGYDGSSALTITGTAYNDTVSDRDSDINPGGYSISTYAGIDVIDIDNSKAADTVDAGADNDFVFVTTASGKSFTSDTAIKGGLGSDWLIISSAYSGGTNISINYTINSSPTSGFENVLVSSGDDALTGDASNNILLGSGGADTINGLAGNDSLYGYHLMEDGCSYGGSNDGSDKLYGGDGDDLLVGGAGDDLFDGGIGQDTLTGDGGIESCGYLASQMQGGASGSDTFVIRSGDGGSSITDADIITDFTDGTDIIGMSGLNYNQLTIEQGTGSYSSHVVVKKLSTGEFLTIIQNVSLSIVDDNDFSAI